MSRKCLLVLSLACALALGARESSALGTTSGTNVPANKQHGPNIYKAAVTDAAGNEYWVLNWSICPQFICGLNPGAAGNGFRAIPAAILGGNDRPQNAVAIGVTLPPIANALALTIRDHGDVLWPMDNAAAWVAAYPPVLVPPGLSFQPAFTPELTQIQSVAKQGPGARAFEIWTPSIAGFSVSAGFFDVWVLIETPPGTSQTDLQGPYLPSGPETGSVGLYYVDYASPTQNIAIVRAGQDAGDPCTLSQPQIIPYDLRDCVLAGAQAPGTPGGGTGFNLPIRENFAYPPFTYATDTESAVSLSLTVPVEPGFVVFLDDSAIPADSVANWSDILHFSPPGPGGPQQALMLSDPVGRPFTDADLAQYGISISQIKTGNTVYVPEQLPATVYTAGLPATGPVATYTIYSDVDTLPPGAPLMDVGAIYQVAESVPDPLEPIVAVPLNMPVQPGFVVLIEDSLAMAAPEDTTHWSDVLYFPAGNPGDLSTVFMASDQANPSNPDHGMTSADLAPLTLTIRDVLEGNTIYVLEKTPTLYLANNPNLGNHTNTYVIVSDSVETTAVPAGAAAAALAIRAVSPNPARGPTRIDFSVPKAGRVQLDVYDLSGRRVRQLLDRTAQPGAQSVVWDGLDEGGRMLPAGTYFARLKAAGGVVTRHIQLIR